MNYSASKKEEKLNPFLRCNPEQAGKKQKKAEVILMISYTKNKVKLDFKSQNGD